MTTLTDVTAIKHLVDQGHTVYAGSDAYRVICDSLGQYLIDFNHGQHYIGLTDNAGNLNMTPVYIK